MRRRAARTAAATRRAGWGAGTGVGGVGSGLGLLTWLMARCYPVGAEGADNNIMPLRAKLRGAGSSALRIIFVRPTGVTLLLRAGRGLRWRIHALQFDKERFAFGAAPRGPDGLPNLIIEVAQKPELALRKFESAPFIVRGATSYAFRDAQTEFEGCYLTAIASKQFEVPDELGDRFRAHSDAPGILGEVAAAVGDLRGDLRQEAIQAGTVCAVQLVPAVLEPWLEFDIYWPTPTHQRSTYASAVSEVLDGRNATEKEVLALGENVVLAMLESEHRRAVQLAGNWYLKGRSEPAASTERFVGLFQCIEALTNCAPQHPDPKLLEWFEVVGALVSAAEAEERQAIEATLNILKQRVARPVLSERFRRLLDLLAVPEKEERALQFEAMNRLRNDLLHAHVAYVPGTFRGYDVDRTITELATTVLTAVVDQMIASAKTRRAVGFTDARDAV